ncbi:MAG: hypothetical protein ACPHQD_16675 [Vibrio toranzoniae]|jgi:hypothetical protein|uniref:KTSC domain-containing protein n=1 Tax=Vibrio rumoiensis TaxID=76258 RepID=A0ABW7J0Y4_9VIBR|nr:MULTISPECIES: hypothetical protein [Vibrio]MDA0143725.1 hypothetical protein [Vibrio sp. RW]NAZ55174.1 hypothetical protein [Vibrio toranzoniae]NAZ92263.1 hypothetical protein [Vibrio toranzoniae]
MDINKIKLGVAYNNRVFKHLQIRFSEHSKQSFWDYPITDFWKQAIAITPKYAYKEMGSEHWL